MQLLNYEFSVICDSVCQLLKWYEYWVWLFGRINIKNSNNNISQLSNPNYQKIYC